MKINAHHYTPIFGFGFNGLVFWSYFSLSWISWRWTFRICETSFSRPGSFHDT